MGISEGKITLYTAAAGVNPMQCLPICVDIGTNTPRYLEDPDYRGIKAPRITGTPQQHMAAWHHMLDFSIVHSSISMDMQPFAVNTQAGRQGLQVFGG
jgi:malic enzyme